MVWAVVPARVGVFALHVRTFGFVMLWPCWLVIVPRSSGINSGTYPQTNLWREPDVSQPTGKKIDSECPRAPAEPRTHADDDGRARVHLAREGDRVAAHDLARSSRSAEYSATLIARVRSESSLWARPSRKDDCAIQATCLKALTDHPEAAGVSRAALLLSDRVRLHDLLRPRPVSTFVPLPMPPSKMSSAQDRRAP